MTTADKSIHRPGAISAFFVYKAALFALCFWGWLGYLAVRGIDVSGWHLVAATGAITTTLAAVILGVRYAIQRSAAARHAELMRTLVEISWNSFTAGAATTDPPSATELWDREARDTGSRNGDADVIRLPQDQLRQRPRR